MERGFTLVEVLVASGIILLTTSLLFVNWRSAREHLALERAVSQVAQDVTRAQELALRSQAFSCSSGSISGYGLYFDITTPSSYLLFAECNGNNTYQAGVDGLVETISFKQGITFSSLSPENNWSVVFVPPEPRVFLKPGDPSQAQVTLGLLTEPGFTRIVTVNSRGVIDIQ